MLYTCSLLIAYGIGVGVVWYHCFDLFFSEERKNTCLHFLIVNELMRDYGEHAYGIMEGLWVIPVFLIIIMLTWNFRCLIFAKSGLEEILQSC